MRVSIELSEDQYVTLCKELKTWKERDKEPKRTVADYIVHILKISALTDLS